jgi:phage terminase large subunit-like protein
VVEFTEALCRITKETVAGRVGEKLVMRSWQAHLLSDLYTVRAGRRRYRQALIGLPRKNGKSALGSAIALHGLLLGPQGAEVYSCAGDKDQARIVFGMAKRMVELEPELEGEVKCFRDAIECPASGSVYRVVSSDAPLKEGLSPTLVVFDELHVQPNDELWNVMTLGSGARIDPLVVGITTAGSRTDSQGRDTVCYRLYQHGRRVASGEVDDPTFYFAWWEPRGGSDCDHRSEKVWREANPGFEDIVAGADFESTVLRTPEAEFRTKRTNVWVVAQDRALPHGAWQKCRKDRVVDRDEPVVLGFDGSWNGDATGIVACTLDGHLSVVELWERPANVTEWHVPVIDVEERLLAECKARNVVEIAADPFRWQRSISLLRDEHFLPVEEYPNSASRTIPAWQKFSDAVQNRDLTHDGDPRLARHMENMVLKRTARGTHPIKDAKSSDRKIDLGMAAVFAYDRATWWREQPLEPVLVVV